MISQEQAELRAGILLGELQKQGYSPKDVIAILVLLVAYMTERISLDKKQARDLFVKALDECLNEVN